MRKTNLSNLLLSAFLSFIMLFFLLLSNHLLHTFSNVLLYRTSYVLAASYLISVLRNIAIYLVIISK